MTNHSVCCEKGLVYWKESEDKHSLYMPTLSSDQFSTDDGCAETLKNMISWRPLGISSVSYPDNIQVRFTHFHLHAATHIQLIKWPVSVYVSLLASLQI